MSDLPFDPEADNAWEAMAKLVALDQMERTDPVMGVWFTLVARQTSAGSTERGLLRERAIKTKVVGNTPVLDQGLAVADFRLQHEQMEILSLLKDAQLKHTEILEMMRQANDGARKPQVQ